jgi:glycosyltransferase involved in cell wall biosynthesis
MKLKLCLILPEPYNPDMPAWPSMMEVYGERLPRFGHKVTWIVPSPGKTKKIQEEFFKKVHIYTIPYPGSRFLLMRIFNRVVFNFREIKLILRILKRERFDIIQVRAGVFNGLLGMYIRKRYKIPFVFQYLPNDKIAQEMYKMRIGKNRHLKYLKGKLDEFLINRIIKEADIVLSQSKCMKEELVKRGAPDSRIEIFPLGANINLFSPDIPGLDVLKEYNLDNLKVVIYVGAMVRLRQLDIVIRAFVNVKKRMSKVKLLMVGDGEDRGRLERLAHELKIKEDVIFTGRVPYFKVPSFIAASNIVVSPIPPLLIYKITSPTKIFEYMAMGKPVVANDEIPEQEEVIRESEGGILVKFEDESFANGIMELLNNPEEANEMGRRGREWVVKNRSYEILARALEKAYFRVLGGN